MSSVYIRLETALQQLQQVMINHGEWQAIAPSADAFASESPFCADTMTFSQWLQWLFIPRLQALIDAQGTLPSNCAVAPMADVSYMDDETKRDQMTQALSQVDAVLTGENLD